MVLIAHWAPAPAAWRGPQQAPGGTRRHRRWQGLPGPRSTHREAGGPRRPRVAGLPWRSLHRRRTMLSPLQCSCPVLEAQWAPVSPHPCCPQHSPAPLWLQQARQGHVPPEDPWEGEERSCRGAPAAPAPAAPAAQPGTRTQARPLGPVTCTSPGQDPLGTTCPGLSTQGWPGDTQTWATAVVRAQGQPWRHRQLSPWGASSQHPGHAPGHA